MVQEHIKESLDRYAKDHVETGGFLRSVLENNLSESVARADDLSKINIVAIVTYVYNELPAPCWGSPEKVEAWLSQREV
jgi:hypothetical protein